MDISNWPLFQIVCLPAWFIVFSTIFLMCMASWGKYQDGYLQGKINERESQMDREDKDEIT